MVNSPPLFDSPLVDPALLWPMVQQQSQQALACGALQPIQTHYEFIEQEGMGFVVRIVANLIRKEIADRKQTSAAVKGQSPNPFLPYDPDLFVTNLSATHLCLLNKYNVVDDHILIVTRTYEDQDTWLNPRDFHALGLCLSQIDGLAFYNGGRLAGASQRHKHLQLVPPPLCPNHRPLPLAAVIASLDLETPTIQSYGLAGHPQLQHSAVLGFSHGIIALPRQWWTEADQGDILDRGYRALISGLGGDLARTPQTFAYNFLMTRQWMMVVRRRQDRYQSIPVNSLGFAGSLLVKDREQLALVKALGPMTILHQVAG
ncbi:MAG: phosphorylase [Cyanobacteria bacterium REEB459]|nr:phosphorylase [Cyanobacteria bacterium REEB459]